MRWCSWRAELRQLRMNGTRLWTSCVLPLPARSAAGMSCGLWWASKVGPRCMIVWLGCRLFGVLACLWLWGCLLWHCAAVQPSVLHTAGALRFRAALEAHKHWPTDDLALLLAGSFLHASSAAVDGGATSGGAPLAEAGSDMQQDGSADGAGATGSPAAHLWEHVELGLGCLNAAITQGILSRDEVKQVRRELLVQHTIGWVQCSHKL